MIKPNKLKVGDEIRIIAPSRSMYFMKPDRLQNAKNKLEELGFKISFSKNINKYDILKSSSIESRINDIHEGPLMIKILVEFSLVMVVIHQMNCWII